MKIAVTGSRGFVGKNLIISLKGDYELLNLNYDNFNLLKLDKSNHTLKGTDLVINLVGQFSPPFADQINLNVVALQNLVENCLANDVRRVIHVSASAVNSLNTTYALSKKMGEDLLKYHHINNSMKVTILRPSNIYGPGSDHGVVHNFFQSINKSGSVIIYGNGKQERDFLFVSDMVKAIIKAIDYNADFEIFEVGSGKTHTLLDLIETFERVLGREVKMDFKKGESDKADKVKANIYKTKKILKWRPEVSLEEGIRRLLK